MTKALFIPSWYPSAEAPTAGLFIRQQVQAAAGVVDVAVLHVDAGRHTVRPRITVEDGAPVVRASVDARGFYGRTIAYIRMGLAAFEELRGQWGTPDIVHVQALFPAAMIARAIKWRYGIPYVVTEHSEEYLPQSERRLAKHPLVVLLLLRPLAHGASRTIAVSRFLADRLVQLGLAVDPIVIPNVVPACEPMPMPLDAPHVVSHVSVMGPAKNLDMLLEAVSRLRARRADFVVRLVGDGENRPDLEKAAASLALDGVVEFTGRKTPDEVRAVLAESAFTVVSSTHETFSVSAAESLMCGRPVLSTRCGGPEEFITPGVGRLTDVGSVDELVEGLDWMLDHFTGFNPQVLHDYAMARFAPGLVAAKIADVYLEVLGD